MELLIYLLFVVDNLLSGLSIIFGVTSVTGFTCFVFYMTAYGLDDIDAEKQALKVIKKCLLIIAILWFPLTLIPDSKTIAAIYLIPKIVENKTVKELPDKLDKFVNIKFNEWLDNLNQEDK